MVYAILADAKIRQHLKTLIAWQMIDENGTKILERSYRLSNRNTASSFARKINELAERANHHPQVEQNGAYLLVRWWTHSTNGLTSLDIDMAAATDKLFKSLPLVAPTIKKRPLK